MRLVGRLDALATPGLPAAAQLDALHDVLRVVREQPEHAAGVFHVLSARLNAGALGGVPDAEQRAALAELLELAQPR